MIYAYSAFQAIRTIKTTAEVAIIIYDGMVSNPEKSFIKKTLVTSVKIARAII